MKEDFILKRQTEIDKVKRHNKKDRNRQKQAQKTQKKDNVQSQRNTAHD